MKRISLEEAQKQLPDLVGALKDEPVVLLRKGQPCAALVGLSERFDPEVFSLGRNKRFRRLMDSACRRAASRGIPFSEIVSDIQEQPGDKTGQGRQRGKG